MKTDCVAAACAHGERLATAGLPVRENADVVAINSTLDKVLCICKHILLAGTDCKGRVVCERLMNLHTPLHKQHKYGRSTPRPQNRTVNLCRFSNF